MMLQKSGNKFTFALSLVLVFGLLVVFSLYNPLDFSTKSQPETIQFIDEEPVVHQVIFTEGHWGERTSDDNENVE